MTKLKMLARYIEFVAALSHYHFVALDFDVTLIYCYNNNYYDKAAFVRNDFLMKRVSLEKSDCNWQNAVCKGIYLYFILWGGRSYEKFC